ncbi:MULTISPECIES: Arc family DNA-binding protein [unclassified Phaeobacter]|uniref:Arc family DNA-binding protein n=1 Tax=unclassified Phaeobacter TaxID=2621772 RepID=UPI003A8A9172
MTDDRFPSQKLDQYMLRLPDGMRDRIKEAAASNNRSMNAEIVATLEEKYPPKDEVSIALMQDFLKAVMPYISSNEDIDPQQRLDTMRLIAEIATSLSDRKITAEEAKNLAFTKIPGLRLTGPDVELQGPPIKPNKGRKIKIEPED